VAAGGDFSAAARRILISLSDNIVSTQTAILPPADYEIIFLRMFITDLYCFYRAACNADAV